MDYFTWQYVKVVHLVDGGFRPAGLRTSGSAAGEAAFSPA